METIIQKKMDQKSAERLKQRMIIKSIHWGILIIKDRFNIIGRGDIFTTGYDRSMFKTCPFKPGDTFEDNGVKRIITGVELGVSQTLVGLKNKIHTDEI